MNNTNQSVSGQEWMVTSSKNDTITTFDFLQHSGRINLALTIIYPFLIPMIICANVLLIIGIFKTKRIRFLPLEVLFILLFLSDLTFGIVQLPLQIYLIRKKTQLTELEIQARSFWYTFPGLLSGTALVVISAVRYLYVVHNSFYKKIASKITLTVSVMLVLAIPLLMSVISAIISFDDNEKVGYFFAVLSVYEGTCLALMIVFNMVLLKYVKAKQINYSTQRRQDKHYTKIIAIIVGVMVIAYLPPVTATSLVAYTLFHSTDVKFTQRVFNSFRLAAIPPQINAVLNSVIFMAGNSRIKRYYKRLLGCTNGEQDNS